MARGGCLRLTSTRASGTTKTSSTCQPFNATVSCAVQGCAVFCVCIRIGVALPVSRSVTSGSVDLKRVQNDRLLWQSPRCFTLADHFHGQDETCTLEDIGSV